MDAKITLSFDKAVISDAKKFAEQNNISLSRLTEMLLRQITTGGYKTLEEFPISDWVNMVAEEAAVYGTPSKRTRKKMKDEYFSSKK